jgi:hypothetical protein
MLKIDTSSLQARTDMHHLLMWYQIYVWKFYRINFLLQGSSPASKKGQQKKLKGVSI